MQNYELRTDCRTARWWGCRTPLGFGGDGLGTASPGCAVATLGFDVEPLRGWVSVIKPQIREATGRLTPKALHNIAQGRDSAPWVDVRQIRPQTPTGFYK